MSDAIAGIALNIPSIFVFIILYGLAVLNTKRTYYHMRYMIGTALLMIGPGLGRALIIYFEIPPPVAITITLGTARSLLLHPCLVLWSLYGKLVTLPHGR
jgi:hypothetical protein